MKNAASLVLIAGLGAIAAMAGANSAPADNKDCCAASVQDFPKVGGNYGNQNFSALAQITPANVKNLGAAWHVNLEGGARTQDQQASIVVVGGVIFAETSQGNVFAVDGATGQIKWTYKSGFGNQLRRGVAVGGGKVFAAFGGNHVAALDQNTGAVVWVKAIDRGTVARGGGGSFNVAAIDPGNGGGRATQPINPLGGGTLKTAITYYDGLIYFGTADAQRGSGYAVNAETGDIVWQFNGAPGPGEFGNDSWGGDQWQDGGATPWMHPAIDPQLGLIYWTFGNARGGAPTDGSGRPGTNLFANSLVAMNAKTGKMVWYFQSVHHDIWDMDNVMAPVLADVPVSGKMRKIVVYGSKTGMLYVLDRTNGEPITPIVETPVPQQPAQKTWPTQPIPAGDALAPQCATGPATKGPSRVPPGYQYGCLFTPHLDFPVVQAPGTGGGMDWSGLSFDPRTRLVYTGIGFINSAHIQHNGGVGFRPLGEDRGGEIVAFNPATHKVVWRAKSQWSLAHGNGILTTAGGVMFIGQPDGNLLGLDVKTGKTIWQFQTGAGVHTSPAAYEVSGQEYVAVFAGGNGLPYNSPRGDDLWGFRLGAKVAQAMAPTPPALRVPVVAAPVEGATVNNTVLLGRTYSTTSGVAMAESNGQNAMAPQALQITAGTGVTFTNPAGNTNRHCATQFFEGLFSSPPLQPGQSFTYIFRKPGAYYYNDSCTSPMTTGVVIVR
jgi:glucose dehydrogenase/plastocyanin